MNEAYVKPNLTKIYATNSRKVQCTHIKLSQCIHLAEKFVDANFDRQVNSKFK